MKGANPLAESNRMTSVAVDSLRKNLELAKLAKVNITNLEVVQARLERKAERAARRAAKMKKDPALDPNLVRLERARKKEALAQPPTFPHEKEIQEFLIRRVMRIQGVNVKEIFEDFSKSVFDFSNITRPYFLAVSRKSDRGRILNALSEFCLEDSKTAPKKAISNSKLTELATVESITESDVKNVLQDEFWNKSLSVLPTLQYRCFTEYVTNVYLHFGIIKNEYNCEKELHEFIIHEYEEALLEKTLQTGFVKLNDIVHTSFLDKLYKETREDPNLNNHTWVWLKRRFVLIHKNLLSPFSHYSKEDLEDPPAKLDDKVEELLTHYKTFWDGSKWHMATMNENEFNEKCQNLLNEGLYVPPVKHVIENNHQLDEEMIFKENFNFKLWRKLVTSHPIVLERYRNYLKRERKFIHRPCKRMKLLKNKVLERVGGNFVKEFTEPTMDSIIHFCNISERLRNLVAKELKEECGKNSKLFFEFTNHKPLRKQYGETSQQKQQKKHVRERDVPFDDFYKQSMDRSFMKS